MLPSMKYKITEVFPSIQGEGFFTGKPVTFVRFSGCNMACSFCDTDFDSWNAMSSQELFKEIQKYPARHIVLTGGEPSLQLNEDNEILFLLKQAGYFLQMETNGTGEKESLVDWYTVSPKTGILPKYYFNELKLLYPFQCPGDWQEVPCEVRYLQPVFPYTEAVVKQICDYIQEVPGWRLSMQVHKILNIP